MLLVFDTVLVPKRALLVSRFLVIGAMNLRGALLNTTLPNLYDTVGILLVVGTFSNVPIRLRRTTGISNTDV